MALIVATLLLFLAGPFVLWPLPKTPADEPLPPAAPGTSHKWGGGEILSVIVADGLTHRFGSEVALEGLDLVLDSGEHMAVLGENGAGKTTLLRVLATA